MFEEVVKEHHLLGVHIAAGKVRLSQLQLQAEKLRARSEITLPLSRK
jgi:hypothetical protein